MWHILIGQVLTVYTLKQLKKYDWTHTELAYYIDLGEIWKERIQMWSSNVRWYSDMERERI